MSFSKYVLIAEPTGRMVIINKISLNNVKKKYKYPMSLGSQEGIYNLAIDNAKPEDWWNEYDFDDILFDDERLDVVKRRMTEIELSSKESDERDTLISQKFKKKCVVKKNVPAAKQTCSRGELLTSKCIPPPDMNHRKKTSVFNKAVDSQKTYKMNNLKQKYSKDTYSKVETSPDTPKNSKMIRPKHKFSPKMCSEIATSKLTKMSQLEQEFTPKISSGNMIFSTPQTPDIINCSSPQVSKEILPQKENYNRKSVRKKLCFNEINCSKMFSKNDLSCNVPEMSNINNYSKQKFTKTDSDTSPEVPTSSISSNFSNSSPNDVQLLYLIKQEMKNCRKKISEQIRKEHARSNKLLIMLNKSIGKMIMSSSTASCPSITDCDTEFFEFFPIKTIENLKSLNDRLLSNEEDKKKFISYLHAVSKVKEGNNEHSFRNVLRLVFDMNLTEFINWSKAKSQTCDNDFISCMKITTVASIICEFASTKWFHDDKKAYSIFRTWWKSKNQTRRRKKEGVTLSNPVTTYNAENVTYINNSLNHINELQPSVPDEEKSRKESSRILNFNEL